MRKEKLENDKQIRSRNGSCKINETITQKRKTKNTQLHGNKIGKERYEISDHKVVREKASKLKVEQ